MRSLEEKGTQLVRQARRLEAMSFYQTAIVKYIEESAEKSTAIARLAVQCYLNIARCALEPRDPAVAKEAEVYCDRALEILSNPTDGGAVLLATKAYYCKSQTFELRGLTQAAEKEFAVAAKFSPSDNVVSPSDNVVGQALARVRLNI